MAVPVKSADVFEFTCPTRIHFERGAVEDRLGELAGPAARVLVVTGRSSARRSGLLGRVVASLAGKRVAVFDQVEPNPSIETVDRGAALARELTPELIIGVGGGSAMDAAKAIAAVAPNSGSFRQELGKPAFAHPPIRLLAIPTTCGTGSEVNQYAVITDTQSNDKVNLSNAQTFPELAVLDPSVLDDIDPRVMIATALDAFTHAMEGYTSRRSRPPTDAVALEAMSLILTHLPPAVGGDADARANLLYAASLAGIVIAHTGTTVLHAIGYYLTLRHGVPHGQANATLIPLLLDYLRRHIPAKVAAVLAPLEAGADVPAFEAFLRRMGVPTRLSEYGIAPHELDGWAEYVLGKKNTGATVGAIDKETLLALMRAHL